MNSASKICNDVADALLHVVFDAQKTVAGERKLCDMVSRGVLVTLAPRLRMDVSTSVQLTSNTELLREAISSRETWHEISRIEDFDDAHAKYVRMTCNVNLDPIDALRVGRNVEIHLLFLLKGPMPQLRAAVVVYDEEVNAHSPISLMCAHAGN